MAKRVDALKAKQAKQKKIAIGLSLALVLVVAYQGPKTLKMLKGPAPVATDAAAAPVATTAPAVPVAGSVPVATGAPPVAPTQPVVLADSDTPIGAGAGQLLSFERFESSDPFKQQVDVDAAATASSAAESDESSTPASTPATNPATPGSAENPPISFGGGASSGSATSGSAASSGSAGAVPGAAAASPAAATTISVNGVASTVTVGTEFPADNPTFKLVSLAKDGKSVRIGVAGGSLADGGATVKLVVNKALTLQNTADGSRYTLVLLTVEGAMPPSG